VRNWNRFLSIITALTLFFSVVPVMDTPIVKAAEVADNVVRLQPNQASIFHDTNGDGLGEFEGWGTSLCWWANRLGYSETLTAEAARVFFSDEGLDMNIGRYNVGGGDNTTNAGAPFYHSPHIKRSDSAVPGYCVDVTPVQAGKTEADYADFDRVDMECGYAWNYDWNADKNQMNILIAAAEASGEDFIAEAFSNSPPYFMTVSGCSSGNTNPGQDNLRANSFVAFGKYMADVIVHWVEEGVIDFQSVSPMNEPNTNFWGAYSNKQEGCHVDPGNSQSRMIFELYNELSAQAAEMEDERVRTVLENIIYAGTDETSIDSQIDSYKKLSAEAKHIVTRIDTHTYGGSRRGELSELAKTSNENLWMSEVDGKFAMGTNAGEMSAGLGLAERIMTDLNGLKASAWILWNAVDNHIDNNSSRDGGFDVDTRDAFYGKTDMNGGYWGIAIGDHNTQEILLTQKYYAFGQFSRYIRPGDTIIGSSSNTLATYDAEDNQVVIVAINTAGQDKRWQFDLSNFETMGSEVKAIRTSGSLANGEHWADVSAQVNTVVDTDSKNFTTTMKANSITTFIIDNVVYDTENEAGIKMDITADMVTGSNPWNNNQALGVQNVIDNDTSTYFDGVLEGWIQIDLKEEKTIQAVSFIPRSGYAYRCVNASIYGSADGNTWDLLYTNTSTPSDGSEMIIEANDFVSGKDSYRYIKYAVPASDTDLCCNLSELYVYEKKMFTPSLIAKFDFNDENSGFNYEDAKATGDHSLQPYNDGNALYLDGVDDYLSITKADGSSLMTGVDEATITMWVKPETKDRNWLFFMSPDNDEPIYLSEKYVGMIDDSGNLLGEKYKNNGLVRWDALTTNVPTDDWYYVTLVCEKYQTILYVNGEKADRQSSIYSLSDILGKDSVFYLGKSLWSGGEYFHGLIDDVCVYNYALDEESARKLYYGEEQDIPNTENPGTENPGAENPSITPVPGLTVPTTEQILTNNPGIPTGKSEEAPNSKFGVLKAQVKKTTKSSNKIQWSKVAGADGYVVLGNKCNSGKNVYGMEVLSVISNNSTTSYTHSNLKKDTYYKYIVQAYKMTNGKMEVLETSKTIHSATKAKKYANVKSLKVNKAKVVLAKKGKTFKLKVTQKKNGKKLVKHRKVMFETVDSKVAAINKKGIIKAKKKGTCTIYVYAQNGVYKKVKVTVKK